jgi:Domain of unknown function (DUF4145)
MFHKRRDEWASEFECLPAWECPTCNAGTLRQRSQKTHIEERGPYKTEKENASPVSPIIWGRMTSFLECPKCFELVAVLGDQSDDGKLRPLAIHPPVLAFAMPVATPTSIVDQIHLAFALIWPDHRSAANKIRQAIEVMLTEKDVPSAGVQRDGKSRRLPLPERIEKFDFEFKEMLLSCKLVGDAGSHPDQILREDVLDSFDIMEHVLWEVFEPNGGRVGNVSSELSSRLSRRQKGQ